MELLVVDVPPKFGMSLSRSWEAKLKGTLQMDMSYDTITVFGEQRRSYREHRLAYMVSSKNSPENHPIYVVDTDLGSSILYNDLSFEEIEQENIKILKNEENQQQMQTEQHSEHQDKDSKQKNEDEQ